MSRLQEALTRLRQAAKGPRYYAGSSKKATVIHVDLCDLEAVFDHFDKAAPMAIQVDLVEHSQEDRDTVVTDLFADQVARKVAGIFGDALGYFWNAALIPTHNAGDQTANAVMGGMVEGMAAVAGQLEAAAKHPYLKEEPHG